MNTTPNDVSRRQLLTLPAKAFPHDAPLEALPKYWRNEIGRLRKESARARIALRDTCAALAEAQSTIVTLRLDVADLRAGIAVDQ